MRSSFTRDLLRFAVPIGLQNLIVSGVNLADTVMVGSLGTLTIAAVGLANQVYFLLILFLFGIGSGSAVFSAQYWGKGDVPGVRRTLGLSLLLALAAGTLYTVAAVAFPAFVLGLYSSDPAVVAAGVPYLRAAGLSYPATAVTFVFSLSLRSVERVRLPLWGTVLSLAVNVVLNYALIFGAWGFPRLGALGAGIATTAARWLEVFVVVGGSYARGYPNAGPLRDFLSLDRKFLRSFAEIASPVVLNEVAWSLGITAYSAVFARVSTEAIASFNILQTVNQVLMVLVMGTSSAAAVMIGKKIGEGDHEAARATARGFERLAPLLGAGLSLLALAAAPLLPFVFSVDQRVLSGAAAMLVVLAAVFPVKSYNIHFIVGINRAGGDTRFGLLYDVGGIWGIGVPAAVLGAFVLRLPAWAVFLLASSEELAKSTLAYARLRSGKWLRSVT